MYELTKFQEFYMSEDVLSIALWVESMKRSVENGDNDGYLQLADALQFAIRMRDLEMVEFIFDTGVIEANAIGTSGKPAIFQCFDIRFENPQRNGPVVHSGKKSPLGTYDQDCLNFLLERGADLHVRSVPNNSTLLHLVAYYGNHNAIDLLLHAGVHVDSIDADGCTPLHFAVSGGHIKCVQSLLMAKADVNIVSEFLGAPIHVAYSENRQECIALLERVGARH